MRARSVTQILGVAGVIAAGIIAIFASTPGPSNLPPAAMPSNVQLLIPSNPTGPPTATTWSLPVQMSPMGSYTVLPFITAAPTLRVNFDAPYPTTLHVRATDKVAGALAEIPLFTGPPLQHPPNDYYEIINVDPTKSPAWTIEIVLPGHFLAPSFYTIYISTVSQNSGLTGTAHESIPFALPLVGRNYEVAVAVTSGGHITSNPSTSDGGISCASNDPRCDGVFPPPPLPTIGRDPIQTIQLNAQSFQQIIFAGWSGACSAAPPPQSGDTGGTCTLTLDGTDVKRATAAFDGNATPSLPASMCVGATMSMPGLVWQDIPECTPSLGATTVALCDGQGFYCCNSTPGATSARCGGAGMAEFPPDCHQNSNYMLRNPGGCYVSGP